MAEDRNRRDTSGKRGPFRLFISSVNEFPLSTLALAQVGALFFESPRTTFGVGKSAPSSTLLILLGVLLDKSCYSQSFPGIIGRIAPDILINYCVKQGFFSGTAWLQLINRYLLTNSRKRRGFIKNLMSIDLF